MNLSGLAVGDIITQFRGPITGVNYGGSATAYCNVHMRERGGGAAVKVQYNNTPVRGYDALNETAVPDPTQWQDIATINSNGLTQTPITVRTNYHWIRVVVSTAGTGYVVAGGLWAKRGA